MLSAEDLKKFREMLTTASSEELGRMEELVDTARKIKENETRIVSLRNTFEKQIPNLRDA